MNCLILNQGAGPACSRLSAEQGHQLQGNAILGQIRPEPGLAFIVPHTSMLTKEPEMLQPDAFCEHTKQQNAIAGSLEELTALPQTP